MMMKVAADANGKVTWNSFLAQFDSYADADKEADLEKLQKESFERIASFGGNQNEIDTDTLASFFKAIDMEATEEEIDELMRLAGNSKDSINVDDYLMLLDEFEDGK